MKLKICKGATIKEVIDMFSVKPENIILYSDCEVTMENGDSL